jgi:AraC-like DNA-binding protein
VIPDRDQRFRAWPKIGHLQAEIAVTFPRNDRSRSSGTAGHVQPESAVTLVRNTHLRAQDEGLVPQLRTALDFIRQECLVTRPGFVAVAARLMDLLFIQILRAAITQPTANIGFLAGLSDDHIGRALAAIHSNPAGPWTVAKLAAEARHSRTIFAARFKQLVGLTPMQYTNQWRIARAEHLLAHPETPIDAIRRQLGFSTSFAFARAFRAQHGMSPREFRVSLEKARTASTAP